MPHHCFHKVMPQWLFGPHFVLHYSAMLKPESLTLRISSRAPLIGLVPNEYSPFHMLTNTVVGLGFFFFLLFFSEGEGEGNRGIGKQRKSPNHWRSQTEFHLKGGEVNWYCTSSGAPLKSASWRHSSLPGFGSVVPIRASQQLLFMTLALCIKWNKYRMMN